MVKTNVFSSLKLRSVPQIWSKRGDRQVWRSTRVVTSVSEDLLFPSYFILQSKLAPSHGASKVRRKESHWSWQEDGLAFARPTDATRLQGLSTPPPGEDHMGPAFSGCCGPRSSRHRPKQTANPAAGPLVEGWEEIQAQKGRCTPQVWW